VTPGDVETKDRYATADKYWRCLLLLRDEISKSARDAPSFHEGL
jgi:hypothetical protein